MDINNSVKPFYIYTDSDNLYIKNINEETYQLENNVKSYSASIDDNEVVHLCCINSSGKLIYIHNKNNFWKKRVICTIGESINNIVNMKLYIVNRALNIFILENNSMYDELYDLTHVYTEAKVNKIYKHNINNILKDKESIYKINIDNNNDIILEYNVLEGRSHSRRVKIFKSKSKKWSNESEADVISIKSTKTKKYSSKKNIKYEISDYSDSIKYNDK